MAQRTLVRVASYCRSPKGKTATLNHSLNRHAPDQTIYRLGLSIASSISPLRATAYINSD